jgi:hypothetical protein
MISVKLVEGHRTFELKIGDLKVGKVLVYQGSGRAASYVENFGGDETYLSCHETLTQAVRRILEAAGYGRAEDFEVERAPGGRKR